MNRSPRAPVPRWTLGLLVALSLGGCSQSPPSKAPATAPLAPAEAAAGSPQREAPTQEEAASLADDDINDRAPQEKKEKSLEEQPSLSQPPAAGGPLPSEEDELEQLDHAERQFQKAIDPEALSCAGALPRRDAICTLADRICELVPPTYSLSAEKDCETAQSACTNAKASYRNRCGG